ncbi:MAG TPA: DUF4426 domain-containing protein [Dokdonella sp.]|uniref:DUF4426 domain-containing protein n=1 Tax=Dokdonella sp. TaxID=2291710 RepID=UPI002D7F3D6E|nr:DUF4426 domain-containing protein [Dokdonella sp.]HET9032166.1 DUF4426 domain-containing protein [Dokdonella sp.]
MKSLIRCFAVAALLVSSISAIADSGGTQKFGNYLVHYSALSTQFLNAGMAKQYSIERSANRGLINISVQKVAADETAQAVAAVVSGEATNLTGQKTPVTIREIPDQYVSYIGLFNVTAPDTYTFTLKITPKDSKESFTLKFSKNFVAE